MTLLRAALLPVALGAAILTAPPAWADTGYLRLEDRAHSTGSDRLSIEIRNYVTYPLAGGRGTVTGNAVAAVAYGVNGTLTLSSHYTVWRVADAAWRGQMGSTSNFRVGGLTAYHSIQRTAANPRASIWSDLTAFMRVGAAIEHSATASFTPAGGVRISVTAWDRHTLY